MTMAHKTEMVTIKRQAELKAMKYVKVSCIAIMKAVTQEFR